MGNEIIKDKWWKIIGLIIFAVFMFSFIMTVSGHKSETMSLIGISAFFLLGALAIIRWLLTCGWQMGIISVFCVVVVLIALNQVRSLNMMDALLIVMTVGILLLPAYLDVNNKLKELEKKIEVITKENKLKK